MTERDLSDVAWRKSTYSQQNGNCLETAYVGTSVVLRDSKDSEGPKLFVSKDDWRAFIDSVR
ncbi:hypothetical protein Sme01_68900 [Sphaerisporangium melleum]|uniref:DUF397 domain-containing protein n=1 Tax=Sphaerisporangium melleum TaxID=321316 RepID=A0A917RK23_9ACTN|nr:DUF397 domain-containing protein [Sphaerisporangium melleum]GGL12278.1 hypothetical protein GCM10007964_62930 [Sphaerisporangium melleum]GII74414.1 hypothetical protein Sme01_68900 [Sphaerisporangium melleum]